MIDQLLRLAAAQPAAPFVLHEDARYCFQEMADAACRGAGWLASQGVQPGDHVVLAVSNRPLFLFYWFSLAARGAVTVPIAHDSFGDPLRYTVQQSQSKLVLTEGSEQARLQRELAGTDVPVMAFGSEAEFLAATRAHEPVVPEAPQAHTPMAILYTSGTTGQPKGAMIPVGSYRAIGEKIVQAIGITPADRILTFLPLHHANPQMYSLMSALTVGCSIALAPRFSASKFLDQVKRYGATGFTYVGTVLSILAKEIAADAATTLRWCVGGGAPRTVWEELAARLHVTIHELYGMTETGGMVTINTREQYRMGSVGAIRDDFDVVLVDDNDGIVTQGIGEIAVRPRQPFAMTTGYFDKPAETLAASGNFWFHTGDLGRFDEQGFLFFEGRKKELIRRAGEMISPVTIELAALKHASIADCAAVGVPDPILEEDIKLVVVKRCDVEPADIVAFLRQALPGHMVPRYVQFAAEIPKTPTQKVKRFALASLSAPVHDTKTTAGRGLGRKGP